MCLNINKCRFLFSLIIVFVAGILLSYSYMKKVELELDLIAKL